MLKRKDGTILSTAFSVILILAACSSGLQTDAPDEEPSLATQATTVTKTVPNAVSDAEEQSSGPYYSDSTVLDLGEKSEPQQTGLRFTGINIPKGATITSAKLEFVAVTDTSRSTSLTVRGDKEANAPEFTSSYPQISARPKTTAVTNWVPGAWTSGNTYSTVDFRSVVQELVNQSSWASGNAMAFIIAGSGQRKAQSYDGNSTKAAKLIVTYDVAGQGVAKVYILWGQSNAEGKASYSDQLEKWKVEGVKQAFIWSNNASSFKPLKVTPGATWGAEMQLAQAAYDNNPRDRVYIIKYAIGGVPLVKVKANTGQTWNPSKPLDNNHQTSLYPLATQEVKQALTYIKSRETKPIQIEGFIWVQGEQDSKDSLRVSQYEEAQRNLFNGLRTTAGKNTLPILDALLAPRRGREIINDAKINVAKLGNVSLLNTDDPRVFARLDGSHYGATGQREIGSRAFRYFEGK